MKNTTIDFTSDDLEEISIKVIPIKIIGEINLPERNGVEIITTKEQLRDYFAAKAMQIIMTADDVNSAEVAGMAYAIADAMLKERENEQ